MPTARLSFRAGRSSITVDDAGEVVAVVPDSRPEESYLERAGAVVVRLDGRLVSWSAPHLEVDADEVEISHRHPSLSATVRHSFGSRWGVRLALANLGTERLRLEDVTLGWVPSHGWPAWALAAGAVGSYAVFHPDGRSPVLGGVLALGTLAAVTPDGLSLGPIELEPGGRYATSWHWSWFGSARAFTDRPQGQRGDPQVPRSLQLSMGATALIAAGDDEALVLPPGLATEPVRDQVELVPAGPGRYPVELRTARGVTRYDLTWTPSVEELLTGVAAELLAGPRTPAGIVRLDTVTAALVVQFALRVGLDDADTAEEALDLFAARLDPPAESAARTGTDPRTAGFLCGEFDRTGDEEALAVATGIVCGSGSPVPGLGLAAAQVGLARVLSGLSLDALTEHLARLTASLAPPGRGRVRDQAAALELAVLAPRPRSGVEVTDRLLALGCWLGAGLKGHPVAPRPVAELAHLTAVLAALDEQTSLSLRTHWAGTAYEVGRWTEAAVVARLTDPPDGPLDLGPAHAWLAVAARSR